MQRMGNIARSAGCYQAAASLDESLAPLVLKRLQEINEQDPDCSDASLASASILAGRWIDRSSSGSRVPAPASWALQSVWFLVIPLNYWRGKEELIQFAMPHYGPKWVWINPCSSNTGCIFKMFCTAI